MNLKSKIEDLFKFKKKKQDVIQKNVRLVQFFLIILINILHTENSEYGFYLI